MNRASNIEWTETSWNPSTGCNKISRGCKNCYAEQWAKMHQGRGIVQYKNGFIFKIAENRIYDPYKWKTNRLVFVNSMSDLFHEEMPFDYLLKLFKVMNDVERHNYQILTKRIEHVLSYQDKINWTSNIWLGVSVEDNNTSNRIYKLKESKAKIKFISFEPLLEKIEKPNLKGVDWVIVGGESGPKARKIKLDWITEIQNECKKESIPFFFKQWGKSKFNPDSNDPSLSKSHKDYAKGGCYINGISFKEFPKSIKKYGITNQH